MSDEDSLLDDIGKLPLRSKKFLAYLISEAGWKVALFYLLYVYRNGIDEYCFTIIMTIVLVNGFLQVGYILGEIALDRYSRITENILLQNKNKTQTRKRGTDDN